MRRTYILVASGVLSLALVLATMKLVCVLLNLMFPHHFPREVIWLVK